MNKISIKARLIIGFTISILLTLMLGSFTFYQVNNLSTITARLYRHPFTVTNTIKAIQINVLTIRGHVRDAILAENNDNLTKAEQDIALLEQETIELFKLLNERFLGDKSKVAQSEKEFRE